MTAPSRATGPAPLGCGHGIVCLSDDLSGAAEAGWSLAGDDASVLLDVGGSSTGDHGVRVWDLDLRTGGASTVQDRVRAALERLESSASVAVKIDSLLRGPLDAVVEAVLASGRRALVCPALPAAGRSFVGGRVHAGRGADGTAPGSLESRGDELGRLLGRPVGHVGLEVLRSGPDAAGDALAALLAHEEVLAVDAVTDADLDVVARSLSDRPEVVPLGAAGLLGAIGRRRAVGRPSRPLADLLDGHGDVLTVVGSAETSASAQVEHARRAGATVVTVPCGAGPRDVPELATAVRDGLTSAPTVLTFARGPVDPGRSALMVRVLADVVAAAVTPSTRLALTGGETARRVLDSLGVARLDLRALVHPGAVRSVTDRGRHVVTRPGSHGAVDSLTRIAHHLGAPTAPPPPTTTPATA